MKTSLIMTVLGPDRKGLVRALAETVAEHGGNWQESRMARMAGQFAGILRVECDLNGADELVQSLQAYEKQGLRIHVVCENASHVVPERVVVIDVVGNDRPGIVRQLASAISHAGGNVEDLSTGLESAAMTGYSLFRARGVVALTGNTSPAAIVKAIEELSDDLSVEIASAATV